MGHGKTCYSSSQFLEQLSGDTAGYAWTPDQRPRTRSIRHHRPTLGEALLNIWNIPRSLEPILFIDALTLSEASEKRNLDSLTAEGRSFQFK